MYPRYKMRSRKGINVCLFLEQSDEEEISLIVEDSKMTELSPEQCAVVGNVYMTQGARAADICKAELLKSKIATAYNAMLVHMGMEPVSYTRKRELTLTFVAGELVKMGLLAFKMWGTAPLTKEAIDAAKERLRIKQINDPPKPTPAEEYKAFREQERTRTMREKNQANRFKNLTAYQQSVYTGILNRESDTIPGHKHTFEEYERALNTAEQWPKVKPPLRTLPKVDGHTPPAPTIPQVFPPRIITKPNGVTAHEPAMPPPPTTTAQPNGAAPHDNGEPPQESKQERKARLLAEEKIAYEERKKIMAPIYAAKEAEQEQLDKEAAIRNAEYLAMVNAPEIERQQRMEKERLEKIAFHRSLPPTPPDPHIKQSGESKDDWYKRVKALPPDTQFSRAVTSAIYHYEQAHPTPPPDARSDERKEYDRIMENWSTATPEEKDASFKYCEDHNLVGMTEANFYKRCKKFKRIPGMLQQYELDFMTYYEKKAKPAKKGKKK